MPYILSCSYNLLPINHTLCKICNNHGQSHQRRRPHDTEALVDKTSTERNLALLPFWPPWGELKTPSGEERKHTVVPSFRFAALSKNHGREQTTNKQLVQERWMWCLSPTLKFELQSNFISTVFLQVHERDPGINGRREEGVTAVSLFGLTLSLNKKGHCYTLRWSWMLGFMVLVLLCRL